MQLNKLSSEQRKQLKEEAEHELEVFRTKNLTLDLTRGKPSAEQLSLSDELDGLLAGHYRSRSGIDVRNYGGLDGIEEARELGASMLGIPLENTLAGGNSSLSLMYQAVSTALYFGLTGSDSAWKTNDEIKFLCPVPGYDRHFSVCETLGIEMIPTPMTSSGPDMDVIETLIKNDENIKGLWCVPKYSNPTGVVYSDETVDRIAKLGLIASKNFRVMWDNAYAVHDLTTPSPKLSNIFNACEKFGTQDFVLQFASTSKITHAGAGVAFLGASNANLTGFKRALSFSTIGPDKINQLRHSNFFEKFSLKDHMVKHAQIIKPRFDVVLKHLSLAFADNDLGQWEEPLGGYFISFDTQPGLAKRVVALAASAGVKLTPAGATFPYGKDPDDKNIRIAPTVPSVEELEIAMAIFTTCVKVASYE